MLVKAAPGCPVDHPFEPELDRPAFGGSKAHPTPVGVSSRSQHRFLRKYNIGFGPTC